MNKFVSKMYPYFGWFFLVYYFFQLLYVMACSYDIDVVDAVLGPIDYLVDALLFSIAYVLGLISDVIFDDNLILNAKYTTLGDANATDIQTLIFSIEERMELIADKLEIFQDIVHSPEFIANLQSHGNVAVVKFSFITFLIDSSMPRWFYLEMLEHTIVNSFYATIYSMSDIYVTNWFWRMFNNGTTPFAKLILTYFDLYLEIYHMDLVSLIDFCQNLQRSPVMSVKEMTVNLEFFRIIYEGHLRILMAHAPTGPIMIDSSETQFLVHYKTVEANLAGWLEVVNDFILDYKDTIEIPNKSFLFWLRQKHKQVHPQLC